MSVKHNKRESIIDALNKAQHIAFGPVLFQAVRAALNTGFLHRLAQTSSGEQEAARAGLQIETVRNDIGVSHTLYVLKAK